MSLRIYTLGPFRVHRSDSPIPDPAWKTQKNKALLKILLTYRRRALTKEQLMEWLWPHLDPDAAGRNLRVAVSQLRRALEPDLPRGSQSSFILTTDAGYAWNTKADYWLDAEEFERLAASRWQRADSRWQVADSSANQDAISHQPSAISHMQSAISLYQGDYLEEDRYADWATAERERLRELYFALLTRLAEAYARQGRYQRAVASCREVLAADRCRESVWCQLMLYHHHAGDQALALRAYEECRHALAEELAVEPLPETIALYEQVLRREVPAPRRDIPNNLPHELTNFVGRQEELAEIAARLENPACRLLTLAGPGGVGKTRLALRAASERMAQYPDGVYFVRLAPLSSADFMVAAIAEALGIHFYGREDPKVQLLNRLREKRMLLVMDNFEHLLAGAELVIEILQHAPEVKILVTSREPLNFQAEWCVDIEGLLYPEGRLEARDWGLERETRPSDDTQYVIRSTQYAAVRLFVERAGQVRAGFRLSQATTPDVVRICQFLEGMPLGIELAAAWVRRFSCSRIVREIERNRSTALTTGLDFLTTSMRDVPERHRSLRAVFDWSWNLLSEEERASFRKLSVCRGGFRSEAAEQVAGASPRVLASLVGKSMLRRTPAGRYEMHELLRQYAGEKLHAFPADEKQAQELHCRYYATFLHQREEAIRNEARTDVLDEVGDEIENVRHGWEWAIAQWQVGEIGKYLDSLYHFYWIRGWYHEGEEVFGRAAERLDARLRPSQVEFNRRVDPGQAREVIQGKILLRQGRFCFRLNHYKKARDVLRRSLAVSRHHQMPEEIASTLHTLGYVAYMVGDYEKAKELCQQSLAICEEARDRHEMAKCLNALGLAVVGLGQYAEARRLHERSLAVSREIGNQRTAARALSYLGLLAGSMGEYAEARKLCRESLEVYGTMGDQWGVAHTLDYLGNIARWTGEYAEAERLYQESAVIWREIGHRWGIAVFAMHMGELACLSREYTEARHHYEEGLGVFEEIGDRPGIASCLGGLGRVAQALGHYEEAGELFHESLAVNREINKAGGIAMSLQDLGNLAGAQAEKQAARAHCREALKIAVDINAVPLVLEILVGIAVLLTEEGEGGQALELLSLACHHAASTRQTRDRAEYLRTELEPQLPPGVIAEGRRRREARTLNEVVNEVLAAT
ncbi:MAG: tetratricopeptide repeat protein [Anaerolineae bacterium]